MPLIKIMDSSGDTQLQFNKASAREAEALFDQLLQKGHRAVNVNRTGGRDDEFISKFCQIENETLIIPPLAAG